MEGEKHTGQKLYNRPEEKCYSYRKENADDDGQRLFGVE